MDTGSTGPPGRARLNSARQRRAAGSYQATARWTRRHPAGAAQRTTSHQQNRGSEETSEPRPGTSHDGIDAKKTDADLKIALARFSSAFSRFNRFTSADSSLVSPGR